MNKQHILEHFIAGDYPQIHCEKCESTFLTNVFDFGDDHVLLEKRSLGLEYYCGAIHEKKLVKVPHITRIGIIDEEDNIAPPPRQTDIYSGCETHFRFIYVMEKLQHLNDEDTHYFDHFVKDLDWMNKNDRLKVIDEISESYDPELAKDIEELFEFYAQHIGVIAWDLHSDNLMQRPSNKEIVILDPYTRCS